MLIPIVIIVSITLSPVAAIVLIAIKENKHPSLS
jgi:hypothetical protein